MASPERKMIMDSQDHLLCYCCGWEGSSEDCEELGICPNCNQSGSLQTDG